MRILTLSHYGAHGDESRTIIPTLKSASLHALSNNGFRYTFVKEQYRLLSSKDPSVDVTACTLSSHLRKRTMRPALCQSVSLVQWYLWVLTLSSQVRRAQCFNVRPPGKIFCSNIQAIPRNRQPSQLGVPLWSIP